MKTLILRALTTLHEIVAPVPPANGREPRLLSFPRLFAADTAPPPDCRFVLLSGDGGATDGLTDPQCRPETVDAVLDHFELLRARLLLLCRRWDGQLRADPDCQDEVRRDVRRAYAHAARRLLDVLLCQREEPPPIPATSAR